jgi:circadian clock protein KaiB
MSPVEHVHASRQYEHIPKSSADQTYVLRLYVTGASATSTRAVTNIKRICEEHLKGRYRLEVIDIFQQPALAAGEQIIATPTLVKVLPPPLRRFVGDLARTGDVLLGLGLRPVPQTRA